MNEVVVRHRRTEDLPALGQLLAAQQPLTEYPLRWPLPFPVEDFLVRPTEQAAWVAELAGAVAGHVSVGTLDEELAPAFAPAHDPAGLAMLTVLFVGTGTTGLGIGGRLHDTAVAWIRASGRVPALDVVPTHRRAVELYLRLGWRVVGEARPGWLPPERPALHLMVLED